jgi:hypothetical protein
MSLYEQAYRDGAITYESWQYFERMEQDFRDGKGRYAIGSERTDALMQQMLMEPIPVRIVR